MRRQMATKGTSSKQAAKKTATKSKSTKSSKRSAAKDFVPVKRAKSAGWLAILESLAIGVFGALLIWKQNEFVQLVFYAIGIFLMIKGVYKIINYFAIRGRYDFYNNDLLYGIMALVFGIVAVVLWEQLGHILGIVVGAWMIYGALVRMNTAMKMHAVGIRQWTYVLLLSMVMLALGIYMIVSVGAMSAIIGWVMIAAAVIGIVDDLVFIQHLDQI